MNKVSRVILGLVTALILLVLAWWLGTKTTPNTTPNKVDLNAP